MASSSCININCVSNYITPAKSGFTSDFLKKIANDSAFSFPLRSQSNVTKTIAKRALAALCVLLTTAVDILLWSLRTITIFPVRNTGIQEHMRLLTSSLACPYTMYNVLRGHLFHFAQRHPANPVNNQIGFQHPPLYTPLMPNSGPPVLQNYLSPEETESLATIRQAIKQNRSITEIQQVIKKHKTTYGSLQLRPNPLSFTTFLMLARTPEQADCLFSEITPPGLSTSQSLLSADSLRADQCKQYLLQIDLLNRNAAFYAATNLNPELLNMYLQLMGADGKAVADQPDQSGMTPHVAVLLNLYCLTGVRRLALPYVEKEDALKEYVLRMDVLKKLDSDRDLSKDASEFLDFIINVLKKAKGDEKLIMEAWHSSYHEYGNKCVTQSNVQMSNMVQMFHHHIMWRNLTTTGDFPKYLYRNLQQYIPEFMLDHYMKGKMTQPCATYAEFRALVGESNFL